MPITVNQEVFTGMTVIRASDEITSQALCLTPAQAVELRAALNAMTIQKVDDPAADRESRTLIGLTIYNGHCLPTIDRAKYEANRMISVHFDFEIRQRIRHNGNIIVKVVGTL